MVVHEVQSTTGAAVYGKGEGFSGERGKKATTRGGQGSAHEKPFDRQKASNVCGARGKQQQDSRSASEGDEEAETSQKTDESAYRRTTTHGHRGEYWRKKQKEQSVLAPQRRSDRQSAQKPKKWTEQETRKS